MFHHANAASVRIFPDGGVNRDKRCENAMFVSEIGGANYLICSRLSRFALGGGCAVAESAETGRLVVVDHAGRLHERVADRRSDKLAAVFLESAAHGVGDFVGGGRLCIGCARGVDGRIADKRPHEIRERAVFRLDALHRASVSDGRRDLRSIADDAGVEQQPGCVVFAEGGHPVDVEVVEQSPVTLTLVQNRQP